MNAHIMRSGRVLLPLALFVSAAVEAMPINDHFSFEDDLNVNGNGQYQGMSVVSGSYVWGGISYSASEGDRFALLKADTNGNNGNGNDKGRAFFSAEIGLDVGQKLSFDWIFLGAGAAPFLDIHSNLEDIPFTDILVPDGASAAGWNTSGWIPNASYNGKIVFVVRDSKDASDSPILLLDNLRISQLPEGETSSVTNVPEPNILALCGLGLLALGAGRRLNRK